ncbi:MAG: N-acetylmuramic acid 6-phosphate etherase [Planctomycetota bacterium]
MTDPTLPADRGGLTTEHRLPESADFDGLTTLEQAQLMNRADRTVIDAVDKALPDLTPLIDRVVESLRAGGRLVYLGAGTSGRLGVLDASECPPTYGVEPGMVVGLIAGGDSALRVSSEGKEDEPDTFDAELNALGIDIRDTVVGIAAGGTTPCVRGALKTAKGLGAGTGMIACVELGAVEAVDHPVSIVTGPEVVTGSTRMKAGTATKLALNTITTVAMTRIGKVFGNLMVDLRASNEKLRDRAMRILAHELDIDRAAAAEVLDAARGEVRLALVMGRLGVGRDEAIAKLDDAEGSLREVIGPPRPWDAG